MRVTGMSIKTEQWPLREPFHFAGFKVEALDTILVTVTDGAAKGQGEGVIPIVFGLTLTEAITQLEAARASMLTGKDAIEVCASLAPNAARNALDCALWDLQCKISGKTVWELAGLSKAPNAIEVDQSIGLASPEEMAKTARASHHKILKIKSNCELVEERITAVRAARPDAAIIVDANQSWSNDDLKSFMPRLTELSVSMIEQPLRVGLDGELAGFARSIPIYADESCHSCADLQRIASYYDGINIKLDKSGGLTEALALAQQAKQRGLGLMVGCMAGTSLSMAPAYVVASLCSWADLDGPLLLASDRNAAMNYHNGKLDKFKPELWG